MVYGVAEKKGIRVQLTGIAVPDQYEQLWQLEGRNSWAASNQTSNQPEKLLEESQQVSNFPIILVQMAAVPNLKNFVLLGIRLAKTTAAATLWRG
jgi:hypothetical protein